MTKKLDLLGFKSIELTYGITKAIKKAVEDIVKHHTCPLYIPSQRNRCYEAEDYLNTLKPKYHKIAAKWIQRKNDEYDEPIEGMGGKSARDMDEMIFTGS